jgi:signal transduction histidine kinase
MTTMAAAATGTTTADGAALRALADELRNVELISDLPEDEMLRLAESGRVVRRAAGEVHRREGEPAAHVFILLEGEVRIVRQAGGHDEVLASYGPHTLFGELPVLMGDECFWASGIAVRDSRIFELPKDAFWELVTACPELCGTVLREMARRVAVVESVSQQRARMVSMGTFAAGLAHELNNPASAARRATGELSQSLHELKALSIRAGRLMSDEELIPLCEIYDAAMAAAASAEGGMRGMAREDECAEWLEARGVADAWTLAPNLADAGLSPELLDRLAGRTPAEALDCVLRWLDVRARSAAQIRTAAEAAARVAEIVGAMKGYTHLGQAPLLEVSVNEGIDSTIAVLRPRLAAVRVECAYDAELPRIRAWGGELNQVWTALLENCADHLRDGGHVWIRTAREGERVRVEIEDDGPGIPPDIQGRVFDPFFTTKDVGEGPGLGLTGAHRIVSTHGGTIDFRSRPGCTVFEVRLPLEPPLPGD